jgi:hypothetical protein
MRATGAAHPTKSGPVREEEEEEAAAAAGAGKGKG